MEKEKLPLRNWEFRSELFTEKLKNMIFLKNNFKIFFIALIAGIALVFSGCKAGGYSLSGATIVGETISVKFFQNKADLVQPSLSQVFTEMLRDKFVQQSSLELVESDGDLNLDGEIIAYNVSPQAIQGDETAALNRLTITVKVRFTNKLKKEDNFESTFKAFEDYDSNQSLSTVEEELINTICERLVEDIFNKAVVNW
jgi:hypothetical protein